MKALFNTEQAKQFVDKLEDFVIDVIEFKKYYDSGANSKVGFPQHRYEELQKKKEYLVNALSTDY